MSEDKDQEVIAWLEQEYAHPFEGWDFSYLKDRRVPQDSFSWNYNKVAEGYVSSSASLLDIDTGGGELLSRLLSVSGFNGRACAVEPYEPNVSVARKRLEGQNVQVYDTSKSAANFDDATFDLVLSRHGGSINPLETYRILKPGGHFVTEQVGNRTNMELRELFGSQQELQPDWPHNAHDVREVFSQLGFSIEQLKEHCFPVRFLDVGALVYYLKAVPWEVPGFSIADNLDVLLQLHRSSPERGFSVDSSHHGYLLVARKE